MATSVDLGSLIVACVALILTLSFVPQFWIFLGRASRKFYSWFNAESALCEGLLWADLADGPLHKHSNVGQDPDTCHSCQRAGEKHGQERGCWRNTLAPVFNISWIRRQRRKYKKPDELKLDRKYIRTDAKVITAYLFCTLKCTSYSATIVNSRASFIDIWVQNGLTIAHLKSYHKILPLSKLEIERILDGWPPFYRQSFTTYEGHVLESPIKSFDHIRRPGWIVAIGLGRVQPTDLYMATAEELISIAVTRVKRTFSNVLLQRWPGNQGIIKAIDQITDIVSHGPSGEFYLWNGGLDGSNAGRATISYPSQVPALTLLQCQAVLDVFNSVSITDDQARILEPQLDAALARVVLGIATYVAYDRTSRKFDVPEALTGEKTVYLADCRVDDDRR